MCDLQTVYGPRWYLGDVISMNCDQIKKKMVNFYFLYCLKEKLKVTPLVLVKCGLQVLERFQSYMETGSVFLSCATNLARSVLSRICIKGI